MDVNGDVITIAKNLTWVGANTNTWNTDWIRFPAGYQNAQLVVVCKTFIAASSLSVQLQTSWDTDSAIDVGAAANVTAIGTTTINITTGLGPFVRIEFTANAATYVMISIYLTPKSE